MIAAMRAMMLERQREPLRLVEIPRPNPSPAQVLIRVQACALCRTDLHVVDGELESPKLPLVPGHQIVGSVEEVGSAAVGYARGERIGVPWLGGACGGCDYCLSGQENLCDSARYTGYQQDGGFAEYCVADARFCLRLPKDRDAVARKLGAVWAGGIDEKPPVALDAAIIFAPAGELVPRALAAVRKGATVVCAGIHMSDIPSFPYSLLWGERTVRSVANLTRKDGEDFLSLASGIKIEAETRIFPLDQANQALAALRAGALQGAAVLKVS